MSSILLSQDIEITGLTPCEVPATFTKGITTLMAAPDTKYNREQSAIAKRYLESWCDSLGVDPWVDYRIDKGYIVFYVSAGMPLYVYRVLQSQLCEVILYLMDGFSQVDVKEYTTVGLMLDDIRQLRKFKSESKKFHRVSIVLNHISDLNWCPEDDALGTIEDRLNLLLTGDPGIILRAGDLRRDDGEMMAYFTDNLFTEFGSGRLQSYLIDYKEVNSWLTSGKARLFVNYHGYSLNEVEDSLRERWKCLG